MDNRQIILAQRPVGVVDESTTKLVVAPRPQCGLDEALIKVGMLSIDPTIRTWMNDAPGYLPPIGIGDVIRGSGTGVVVESNSTRYAVGDIVFGMTNWQEWVLATEENRFSVVPKGMGIDLATMMNVLGVTGITAYFGLTEVGQLKVGDVVVVSGAAGATGSAVGQIARAKGASKVIGIAGGAQKCAEVVEKYGFDECLDYREPDLGRRLHEVCPDGIDLYFDNVGGDILDAVLANIAMHARVVLCGAISQYNATERPRGLVNTSMLIMRRGRMQGFIVLDYTARFGEAQVELAAMVLDGTLVHQEHLVAGLEHAPDALNLLFSGGNHGKTLVVVDETVQLA
ncbi:MAG TPA: NADP-dependent oxidoreductase [Acidimicrobiales bacterium]|nr:NADP-dependent oxidoreductase [Acidimicrobiales bacterium]HUX03709.1 NADP-dependent oxidoreductase [Acidimicrobiales bacterium]